jgi:hypothetical protein
MIDPNFDPYDHLIRLTKLNEELTNSHNKLAEHHLILCTKVEQLIEEIKRLRIQLRQPGSSSTGHQHRSLRD